MIELSNVSISYRNPDQPAKPVLENVSLLIERGEMVYLVGPTGSGKSSLLRLMYMENKPDRGFVQVSDYRSDAIKASEIPYLRRSLGVVFQDFQLLPDRSIFDNVAFAQYATGSRGKAVKSKVLHVLSRVGLSHKRRQFPHELSGGEQQRVAIARAIINDPWIILADEPTGSLDSVNGAKVLDLLESLSQTHQIAVLLVTHDRESTRICERIVAMRDGRIVESLDS